jgi:hypothetical protein
MAADTELEVFFPQVERTTKDLSDINWKEERQEVLTDVYKQFLPKLEANDIKFPVLSRFHLGYLLGQRGFIYEHTAGKEYLSDELEPLINNLSRTYKDFADGYLVHTRMSEINDIQYEFWKARKDSIIKVATDRPLELINGISTLLQVKRGVTFTHGDKESIKKDIKRLEAKLELWKRDEELEVIGSGNFIAKYSQSMGQRENSNGRVFSLEEDILYITESLSNMGFILSKIMNAENPVKFFRNLWLGDFVTLVGNRLNLMYPDLVSKFSKESPRLITTDEG